MCIGTASITRSKTATAEAIFWRAIEAFVIRARTTSLDTRSKARPGNVVLARIKTGVPSRSGQYRKQNLIDRYGADVRLPDLRGGHTGMHDACMVRYVDLVS